MKKLLSVILALVLVLALFTACEKVDHKENTSTSSKQTVALETLAAAGKIPEMQFGIGATVDEVKKYYKDQFENNPNALELVEYEVDEYTKLDLGAYAYYYETDNKEAGIVGVTAVDTAFGFTMNLTLVEDVKAAAPADAVLTLTTADDLFFIPGGAPEGAQKLYINTGEYELKLFFFNGYLSAVSLFD